MAARCTFEAFGRSQALLVPTGAALVVGAFGASKLGALLPGMPAADQKVVGDFLDQRVGVLTKSFVKTNYGEAHVMAVLLLAAAAVLGAAAARYAPSLAHTLALLVAVQGSPAYDVTGGIVLLLVAGGVWCLSHGMRVSQAPSYLLYNIRALQRRSLYQIEACETGPLRRLLLVEKSELDRLQAVGTAVLTVAAA